MIRTYGKRDRNDAQAEAPAAGSSSLGGAAAEPVAPTAAGITIDDLLEEGAEAKRQRLVAAVRRAVAEPAPEEGSSASHSDGGAGAVRASSSLLASGHSAARVQEIEYCLEGMSNTTAAADVRHASVLMLNELLATPSYRAVARTHGCLRKLAAVAERVASYAAGPASHSKSSEFKLHWSAAPSTSASSSSQQTGQPLLAPFDRDFAIGIAVALYQLIHVDGPALDCMTRGCVHLLLRLVAVESAAAVRAGGAGGAMRDAISIDLGAPAPSPAAAVPTASGGAGGGASNRIVSNRSRTGAARPLTMAEKLARYYCNSSSAAGGPAEAATDLQLPCSVGPTPTAGEVQVADLALFLLHCCTNTGFADEEGGGGVPEPSAPLPPQGTPPPESSVDPASLSSAADGISGSSCAAPASAPGAASNSGAAAASDAHARAIAQRVGATRDATRTALRGYGLALLSLQLGQVMAALRPALESLRVPLDGPSSHVPFLRLTLLLRVLEDVSFVNDKNTEALLQCQVTMGGEADAAAAAAGASSPVDALLLLVSWCLGFAQRQGLLPPVALVSPPGDAGARGGPVTSIGEPEAGGHLHRGGNRGAAAPHAHRSSGPSGMKPKPEGMVWDLMAAALRVLVNLTNNCARGAAALASAAVPLMLDQGGDGGDALEAAGARPMGTGLEFVIQIVTRFSLCEQHTSVVAPTLTRSAAAAFTAAAPLFTSGSSHAANPLAWYDTLVLSVALLVNCVEFCPLGARDALLGRSLLAPEAEAQLAGGDEAEEKEEEPAPCTILVPAAPLISGLCLATGSDSAGRPPLRPASMARRWDSLVDLLGQLVARLGTPSSSSSSAAAARQSSARAHARSDDPRAADGQRKLGEGASGAAAGTRVPALLALCTVFVHRFLRLDASLSEQAPPPAPHEQHAPSSSAAASNSSDVADNTIISGYLALLLGCAMRGSRLNQEAVTRAIEALFEMCAPGPKGSSSKGGGGGGPSILLLRTASSSSGSSQHPSHPAIAALRTAVRLFLNLQESAGVLSEQAVADCLLADDVFCLVQRVVVDGLPPPSPEEAHPDPLLLAAAPRPVAGPTAAAAVANGSTAARNAPPPSGAGERWASPAKAPGGLNGAVAPTSPAAAGAAAALAASPSAAASNPLRKALNHLPDWMTDNTPSGDGATPHSAWASGTRASGPASRGPASSSPGEADPSSSSSSPVKKFRELGAVVPYPKSPAPAPSSAAPGATSPAPAAARQGSAAGGAARTATASPAASSTAAAAAISDTQPLLDSPSNTAAVTASPFARQSAPAAAAAEGESAAAGLRRTVSQASPSSGSGREPAAAATHSQPIWQAERHSILLGTAVSPEGSSLRRRRSAAAAPGTPLAGTSLAAAGAGSQPAPAAPPQAAQVPTAAAAAPSAARVFKPAVRVVTYGKAPPGGNKGSSFDFDE